MNFPGVEAAFCLFIILVDPQMTRILFLSVWTGSDLSGFASVGRTHMYMLEEWVGHLFCVLDHPLHTLCFDDHGPALRKCVNSETPCCSDTSTVQWHVCLVFLLLDQMELDESQRAILKSYQQRLMEKRQLNMRDKLDQAYRDNQQVGVSMCRVCTVTDRWRQ